MDALRPADCRHNWKTTAALHWLGVFALCLLSANYCPAQTNETRQRTATTPSQIWDYAKELGLNAEQTEAIQKSRAEYETVRADLQKAIRADVPPDVKQAARQAFAEKIRNINQRIGETLTAAQKEKFVELRTGRNSSNGQQKRTAAEQSDKTSSSENENAEQPEEVSSSTDSKSTTRPQLSNEDYRKLAAELRTKYSKPSKEWPEPEIDAEVKPHYVELGLLPPVVYPTNNPYSLAKAELGKKLFFDPRLSGSDQISCASCHDPDLSWGDGRTVAFGHNRKATRRNAPTLLNLGQEKRFFWDGRADSLEDQANLVMNNEDEMHGSFEHVRKRLGNIPGYTNDFVKVFGTTEVTLPRATLALATFVRTITSRPSPFDAFLRGNTNALDDSAIRGLHLFRTTARCANCHHGPNFTDGRFHDEGLSFYGRKLEDLGRYDVTKNPADVGAFKTPTLRNIARTGPYMHNGLFDLDGVLNLYNAGMPTLRRKQEQKDDPLFPKKSDLLKPLHLNKQDLADLKAFLESLTETRLRMRPPELPAEMAETSPSK